MEDAAAAKRLHNRELVLGPFLKAREKGERDIAIVNENDAHARSTGDAGDLRGSQIAG